MSKSLKFAGKLDSYRRMKDLTIAQLSAKVKVDPDTMERLLAGRNAPNAINLLKIMRALEIVFEPEDFEEYGI
jgi:transcriptional regulator with XRE-family HTH domain